MIWVVTDPKAEVIYGTVDGADNEVEAVRAVDRGEARWFAEPSPYQQLSVHPQPTLADSWWREIAPAGAGPHGDCGGDVQVTDSWGRRFGMIRADGNWAVISYSWYGINESVQYPTAGTKTEVVEQQIEFLIVDDPHDLDVNLWWDDDRCKEYDADPTEAGVRAHADDFTVGYVDWDGKEWRR